MGLLVCQAAHGCRQLDYCSSLCLCCPCTAACAAALSPLLHVMYGHRCRHCLCKSCSSPQLPCCPRLQELPEPQLDAETRAAFDLAYENIAAFHRAQQVGGQGDRAGCAVAAAVQG